MDYRKLKRLCQLVWNPVIEHHYSTVSRFARAVKNLSRRSLKVLVSAYWHESGLEIDRYEAYQSLFSLYDSIKIGNYEKQLLELWFPDL